ncbi:ECF-type sigma factor [Paenibacillus sinopodophylli]|uniref:ECF-type sigma factor n=1 Tax=Paenibacillus sinopodophylli TaxID=1837342 RepID=UPI00110CF6CB|nr:ECF-type sigma factor [Paenibacillus sinopodophylli]
MTEQETIEQLSNYKRMMARISVLENYSIGVGMTVSRLNGDDQLQDLHRRLRVMPSYMYLGKREQQLEAIAHAYLSQYPAGVKSQLAVIPQYGADAEDDKLLQELRTKISKVIAARGYDIRDDLDAVLDRLTELQDLQDEINRIDTVLAALETYKPDYAEVLKMVHVEGHRVDEIRNLLSISNRTYWRRVADAEREYKMLAR